MESNPTTDFEETKVQQETSAPLEKVKLIPDETPSVDLCFMLDCTGSMGSYIKMSCEKIKDIINQIKDIYPKSMIRIGIVAYRDITDKNRFEIFSFKDSAEEAKKFLDKLKADGGGDTPEDVNGAFQKALFKMEWESPVRIVVHIADAPCHGKDFHNCDDSYPKGHTEDMDWDKIFQQLVDLRLDYLFLKITSSTDKMFEKFKAFAEKHGASEYELSFTQELANSSANSSGGSKPGEKAKAKPEDHFASTIAEAVKTSLGKEMKKGLATKLEKRIAENADLVNNIKKSVADIVSKMDIAPLREKYADLASKVGDCILSSNNFIDAIADEDCLCLTFDIGRSQAAIADPTQIIIKNVYPSFLTAGSFFFSTEFALKKNKLAHGGFEKHAEGLILKGAASENITGVMPLYFCEENWQVAKQLMKLTIAWDVTLDPLGYTYLQIKTVPFLILAKLAQMMHEKPTNEFLKFQFDLVKRTCIQIMKDGSKETFENKFNKEVTDLYSKYLEDTSVRTIDIIANNSVFLAQLYIAMECGDFPTKGEEYFDAMFTAILEEELRRRQYGLPDVFDTTAWLFKLLNVDEENYIAKPVKEFIDSQTKNADGPKVVSQYEEKFLQILGTVKASEVKVEEEKKEEVKTGEKTEEKAIKGDPRSTEIVAYKQSFTTADGKYNEVQIKAREELNKVMQIVMKYLYPLRMLFTSKQIENPTDLKEWGIQTDSQFFALYIQNKLQSKNAGRREAFANKTYRNPWTQSEEYIQTWYNKLIENEKASRITKFLNSIKEAKSALQANAFSGAQNLEEAAGALLGACIGVDIIDFFNALCLGGSSHIVEKIKMLFAGHYKGVKLFRDAESWAPSRTNGNKLLRAYKNIMTPEEWVALIPTLSLSYATYICK